MPWVAALYCAISASSRRLPHHIGSLLLHTSSVLKSTYQNLKCFACKSLLGCLRHGDLAYMDSTPAVDFAKRTSTLQSVNWWFIENEYSKSWALPCMMSLNSALELHTAAGN